MKSLLQLMNYDFDTKFDGTSVAEEPAACSFKV
jgi:hypothetical protein